MTLQTTSGSPGAGVIPDWYQQAQARINAALHVRAAEARRAIGPHSRLAEAVEYALIQPGKRLRPVLLLEACSLLAGAPDAALPAACAIECIHTFSLVHDDLPAMDDDDLRRGRPTCHKVFGDAAAILAGDWLATYALQLLHLDYPPTTAVRLAEALASATLGMIEGQAADIAGEQQPPDGDLVQYIHVRKTARLLEAATRMGAICASASEPDERALSTYGRRLGLAFQIADDLLDATGVSGRLGKRAGKDAEQSKQTYPAVYGVEASRRRAAAEADAALQAIESYGPRGEHLRDIARYVVTRDR